MHLEVIRTDTDFEALAGEWNALLAESDWDHPFLRHEYLSGWWRTRGGGEWDQAELYVVTARRADRSLAGIAPLFFTPSWEGGPALLLLGSIDVSDYLDFIARPADLPEFIEALLIFLAGVQDPLWETLDLYNVLEDSPTLSLIGAAASRCGWQVEQEQLEPCPYVPLPGNWEEYLSGIKKKQRHEIRRKLRRAESYSETVRWYIIDKETELTTAELEAEAEAFLALMAHDPAKAQFLTESKRAHNKQTIRAAYENGWLQLAFIEIGGVKAAAYFNFDYGGHILVYNSGLDFTFGDLSPGWVLLGYLLQWANENGRATFDFMRGDEEYKYRFGAVDRFITRLCVTRR